MHKVTVPYEHPDDSEAFEEYYANTHLPIAARIPNVQRFESGTVLATSDGALTLTTASPSCGSRIWMGSEEGQAATGDLPNFATGGVAVFISEVE